MVAIKWTNKYSGESGFVGSVASKEKHFVNTFDQAEAKQYKSQIAAKRAITLLQAYGEGENNEFEIVPV